MFPDGPAAAEGDLGQTPFAHLAVYALDRRITGELFLCEPPAEGQTEPAQPHVIRFEGGMPTKIKMGDDFARLGQLLLEKEAIDQATLDAALSTHGGLLGDVLVLSGYAESSVIEDLLVTQFTRRMTRFYSLPPQTQFKYFDKSDTLKSWGGDPSGIDPFALLWSGIECHGECSTQMGATLELVQATPLKLHPKAPYARFSMCAEAVDVVELLALDPTPYEELVALDSVPAEMVKKVIYALLITRQLDIGKATTPVGVEERPATVAKVALKSTVHRLGAAAPDAPGDGERTPVRPMSIRRGSTGTFEVLPREELPEAGPPDAIVPDAIVPDAIVPDAIVSDAIVPDALPAAESDADAAAAATLLGAATKPAIPTALVEAALAARPGSVPDPGPDAKVRPPEPKTPGADETEQDSQKRVIAEAIRGLPTKSLVALAIERIEEKDGQGALEVCRIAREADPENAEIRAAAIWARSLQPSAPLKEFSVELDEALREDEHLLVSRFVRGMLRKRLGEDSGALSDFKKVIAIEPGHQQAAREIALLDPARKGPEGGQKGETGFLKRLFRR